MALSEEELKKKLKQRVMELLNNAGLACYDADEATTEELESEIKGEG